MDSMNYKNDTDFIVQVTLIRRGSKMFSYDIGVGAGNAMCCKCPFGSIAAH